MKTGKLNKAAVPIAPFFFANKTHLSNPDPRDNPEKELVVDKTIQIAYKDRPIL